MFTGIKQSTDYLSSNNCQFLLKFHGNNFKRIVSNEYYLFVSHWQACCGREIITIAAVDANSGFKQFVIAADSYVAMNPL